MNAPPAYESILFQLNVAIPVGAAGLCPSSDYVNNLAEFYGSQLQEVDFSAPDQTAQVINGWVSEQTQGKIENLVDPSSLNPLTRLILINAIYLNAGWALMFDESDTQDGAFTLLDGSQVTVPMMHLHNQFRYIGTESFQAAELDYQQYNFSMLVILPDRAN